jgi:flagellar export protein FliJ
VKKYKFAFGGVMRVRKIAEEQARGALVDAQNEADRASRELHARLEGIGAARPMPGSRSAPEFQADRDHLELHRLAVLAARSAEINALELVGARRAEWVDAARQVRALERLDGRKREEWTLDTTRAAQLVTDEIATIRYRTDKR